LFTGLIETLGIVRAIKGGILEIGFTQPSLELTIGESVSINGVCLSVTQKGREGFKAEVSQETLSRTTLATIQPMGRVNLERSLQLGGRLGGHIVQGHVDGVGGVTSVSSEVNQTLLWIEPPRRLMTYIVEKGSIAINGISLTVAKLDEGRRRFALAILPLTLSRTTLQALRAGDLVNIEVDIIAKYVEKMLEANKNIHQDQKGLSMSWLRDQGFF
jgi:riboflavin synthase